MFKCLRKKTKKIAVVKPEIDRLKVALEITGSFEGAGWGGSARNFDGQGLSFGILQWNYGQGTLQKLLRRYQETQGLITGFPEDINLSAHMSPQEAIEFSMQMQTAKEVKPEWRKSWDEFGMKTVGLQKEMAKPYEEKAKTMMGPLDSIRSFCFFFDVAVQNGSMKGVTLSHPSDEELFPILEAAVNNQEIWKLPSDPEKRMLLKAAWDRAQKSNPPWQMDVFYRKGAIAMGSGYVHRKYHDLDHLMLM